jgi:hypothetical protein
MNFNEKDPVYILENIMDMILKITAEVYETIECGLPETMLSGDKSDTIDKLNLCAVYIDMGIINITTGFLCAYGAAAKETPKFQLKGSGDIVLKADKQKEIYVTKNLSGGSPVGAIHETIDTVTFATKFVIKAIDLIKEAVKLGKASNTLSLSNSELEKIKAEKNLREGEDIL